MKKFLLHIFIALVIVLCGNVLYVLTVGGNLRTYEKKYRAVPSSVNLLILGDSHANTAWGPETEAGRYNFAYGSDNITDMRYKFDYVASHNKEAGRKHVVLPFEGHLISVYRENKHNNKINETLNHPWVNRNLAYLLPLVFDQRTELDLKRFISGVSSREESDTFTDFTKGHARARLKSQFPDSTVSKKLLLEYGQLIQDIKQRGYEIIPIKYPVHPYFDSLQHADPNSRYISRVLDSLASAHALQVMDFSERIRDEHYFSDQDHLNRSGALVFIRKFNDLYF